MNDLSRRIGCRSSALALALALTLALGCSSQQKSDAAAPACGVIADVPIQTGAACTIRVHLPPSATRDTVKIQDQSMLAIPLTNGGDGWEYGDPQTPILLVGSYCIDATEGRITSVTVSVDCSNDPGGNGVADGGPATSDPSSCDISIFVLPETGDAGMDACTYALPFRAPDPNNIRVFEDAPLKIAVPSSPGEGWLYSDATFSKIQLIGSFCADAQAGNIPNLYVLAACSGQPIP